MLDKVCEDLQIIILELKIQYNALPYLMATYKIHKKKYMWLTNASGTVFFDLAHLVAIASNLILESLKQWAAELILSYNRFLQIDTSVSWLLNSTMELALNISTNISNIFIADIARCYESIPPEGDDNLPGAIAHFIHIGFEQQHKYHPRFDPQIWIWTEKGRATKASWATSPPKCGT